MVCDCYCCCCGGVEECEQVSGGGGGGGESPYTYSMCVFIGSSRGSLFLCLTNSACRTAIEWVSLRCRWCGSIIQSDIFNPLISFRSSLFV